MFHGMELGEKVGYTANHNKEVSGNHLFVYTCTTTSNVTSNGVTIAYLFNLIHVYFILSASVVIFLQKTAKQFVLQKLVLVCK